MDKPIISRLKIGTLHVLEEEGVLRAGRGMLIRAKCIVLTSSSEEEEMF